MTEQNDSVVYRGVPPRGEAPLANTDALATAVQALAEATQVLTATATQMMQTMQGVPGGARAEGPARGPAGDVIAAVPPAQVNVWEDDPYSEAVASQNPVSPAPVPVSVPVSNAPLLRVKISGRQPLPARYSPGTEDFRYWVAAEALARGISFWAPLLPVGTRWTTQSPELGVTLVAGHWLNATYRRIDGLRFFQEAVQNVTIFSAESPDVVCHELGHAVLDALRPQLFNTPFVEVSALHESFGDMSAILVGLQLPMLRQKVLDETQGQLNANSRLSRIAEQLGWGIRQRDPVLVDPDSLRNAANSFFYQQPESLPSRAPASQLSTQAHSFSRVFTGAFLDALAGMLALAGAASDANLLVVSRHLGQLLADAIRTAPITPAYFSQVAAAMIKADEARNGGQYANALNAAFLRRGILTLPTAAFLADAPDPHLEPAPASPAEDAAAMTGFGGLGDESGAQMIVSYDGQAEDEGYQHGFADAPEPPPRHVPGEFGLGVPLLAHVPAEGEPFAVAPAALGTGSAHTPSPEQAAHYFVEELIRQGSLDLGQSELGIMDLGAPTEEKTHELVERPEGKVLKRLYFDCGLHHRR